MNQQYQNGQSGPQQNQPNNGYQGRGNNNRGGGFTPPRSHYEWLVQQRIRTEMQLQGLLLQQEYWQKRVEQIEGQRQTSISKKLGLSLAAGISILQGLKQVTMAERAHLYRMQRFDQSEQWAQTKLDEIDLQVQTAQHNLDLLDFEIELETNPANSNGPTPI